jgi:hypothetical protein
VKNQTTFQAILQEAQPSPKVRARNLLTAAATGTVVLIADGYKATIGALMWSLDRFAEAVDWTYDVTH